MGAHTLYIVPTPIGNLEDITLRALRILGEVKLIAAEDTRRSRILLDHYNIKTRMISYHEHNKLIRHEKLLQILQDGDIALISDAGTPGISDPGHELIKAAIEHGIRVVVLPGPCAAITALSASALSTDSFMFLGFPPRKPAKLQELLQSLAMRRETLVFYESPFRLLDTLKIMESIFGPRQAVVGLEMTKYFETLVRGKLGDVIQQLASMNLKGEITLIVEGASEMIPQNADFMSDL